MWKACSRCYFSPAVHIQISEVLRINSNNDCRNTYGRLLNFGTREIIDADWMLTCQRILISTNKLFPKEFQFRLQRAATLTQFMFTRFPRSSDNTHRFITKLGANSLPVRLKVTGYSFLSSKRSNSWWMVFSDANQLYCSWYMNKQDK